MLGDDPLAETLEREPPQCGRKPVEALAEGPQQLEVPLGDALRQVALERDEERPLRGRAPQQEQRVVRDSDER